MTRSILLPATLLLPLVGGCVERRMTITSEPDGALVYMNGREVGRTPIQRDFIWYGDYDVRVRKDGYETLKTVSPVSAPWWQWPPFDLVAELMPWHPTDRQSLHYVLNKATPEDTSAEILIDRAGELKGKIESTQVKPEAK